MGDTFLNGRSIGADETIEAPLIAQHVGEQILVAGGGDTFKLVERTHIGTCTSQSRLLVGIEVAIMGLLA